MLWGLSEYLKFFPASNIMSTFFTLISCMTNFSMASLVLLFLLLQFPFSNISPTVWSIVQKAPLPGLLLSLGSQKDFFKISNFSSKLQKLLTLMKQSLRERLCLMEFCQPCLLVEQQGKVVMIQRQMSDKVICLLGLEMQNRIHFKFLSFTLN